MGGEGTIVFTQTHYENQQTSFSSFVSDTCANSFVFPFGRSKRGSQEQANSEQKVYRHLFQQAWVIQILQSKTTGIHKKIFTFELHSEKQQTEDTHKARVHPTGCFRRQSEAELTIY